MALARPGIDFEGGGTRFIRYALHLGDRVGLGNSPHLVAILGHLARSK